MPRIAPKTIHPRLPIPPLAVAAPGTLFPNPVVPEYFRVYGCAFRLSLFVCEIVSFCVALRSAGTLPGNRIQFNHAHEPPQKTRGIKSGLWHTHGLNQSPPLQLEGV